MVGRAQPPLHSREEHRWRSRQRDLLPALHKDPFVRLLIAQAAEENVTLVSVDPLMRDYPVAVLG